MSRAKSTSNSRKKRRPKPAMSRAEARVFKRRWRLVNAAEVAELRSTGPEKRFDQMIAISGLLRDLGRAPADGANENQARDLWVKLKEAYVVRAGLA